MYQEENILHIISLSLFLYAGIFGQTDNSFHSFQSIIISYSKLETFFQVKVAIYHAVIVLPAPEINRWFYPLLAGLHQVSWEFNNRPRVDPPGVTRRRHLHLPCTTRAYVMIYLVRGFFMNFKSQKSKLTRGRNWICTIFMIIWNSRTDLQPVSESILKIRMVQVSRFFVTKFLPKSPWASKSFESS